MTLPHPDVPTKPDPGSPSRRAATRGLPADIAAASWPRLTFRVRLLWRDDATPSGQREEIVRFNANGTGRLLDLLRRIESSPDRPLLSLNVEVLARPRWAAIPRAFLVWADGERQRRKAGRR